MLAGHGSWAAATAEAGLLRTYVFRLEEEVLPVEGHEFVFGVRLRPRALLGITATAAAAALGHLEVRCGRGRLAVGLGTRQFWPLHDGW